MTRPGWVAWIPVTIVAYAVGVAVSTWLVGLIARPLSTPATLCTLVLSTASSKLIAGKIVGKRFASIVLPEPGGPIMSTL